MAKAPAFQFYPSDWLADAKVKRLSYFAKGVYVELLALMWNEGKDSIPDDDDLAGILRLSNDEWSCIKNEIQKQGKKIFLEKNGCLVSKRLREERRKQRENRKKKKKAAEARWGCTRNADALHMECPSSSSSSSTSSSKKEIPPTPLVDESNGVPFAGFEKPANPAVVTPRPDDEMRAIAHVQGAHMEWKTSLGQIAQCKMPEKWPPLIVETYRARGMEFIELVTPQILAAAFGKSEGGTFWAWSAVTRYLDSDDYRRRRNTANQPRAAPPRELSIEERQLVRGWQKAHTANERYKQAKQYGSELDAAKALKGN